MKPLLYSLAKAVLPILCLLSVSFSAASQEIDLKRVKEQTQDPASLFFYDSLVSQFKTNPAALSLTQGQFLYYGKLFTKGFSAYGLKSEATKAFNAAFREGDFAKAIPLGEKALQSEPVNLELLAGLHACHTRTDQTQKAALYETQLQLLLGAITSSGTGQSLKEGYWVTSVADEYVFLPLMGLEAVRRKGSTGEAKAGMTDIWLIKNPTSGKEEELYLTVVSLQRMGL